MKIAELSTDAATKKPGVRDDRKRILFVDHTAKMGGGEIALLNLILHLDDVRYSPTVLLLSDGPLATALRAQGTEVIVMPLSDSVLNTRKEALGGRSLFRVRAAWSAARASLRIARLIRHGKFDLVHTNSLKADLIAGLAGRLARRKVVWHVRDRIDDDYLPPRVARAFRTLARIIPHFVIANSNAVLKSLINPTRRNDAHAIAPNVNSPSARAMGVVYEGTPVPERVEMYQGDNWSRPKISLVGRLARWKGQHIFIEAAAIVHRTYPEAVFQIIGSAMFAEKSYENALLEQIQRLGVRDVVTMMGFRSDVQTLLRDSTVAVHASITGEPFGQVITEAMALSKPIIATRGGGVPEIVDHGVTGLLIPMDDAPAMASAIMQLLDCPTAAIEMGQRGYDRVLNHFTIQHTAAGVRRVYEQLLPIDGAKSTRQ